MIQHYGNHKIGIPKKKKSKRFDPRRVERRLASKALRMEESLARGEEVRSLTAQGYEVESMNGPYQYRVNGELDIYPKGRKWCDVRHGVWGRYEAGQLLPLVLNFQFTPR